MLSKLIQKISASVDRFVRRHIVDSDQNLWPNLTEEERSRLL